MLHFYLNFLSIIVLYNCNINVNFTFKYEKKLNKISILLCSYLNQKLFLSALKTIDYKNFYYFISLKFSKVRQKLFQLILSQKIRALHDEVGTSLINFITFVS